MRIVKTRTPPGRNLLYFVSALSIVYVAVLAYGVAQAPRLNTRDSSQFGLMAWQVCRMLFPVFTVWFVARCQFAISLSKGFRMGLISLSFGLVSLHIASLSELGILSPSDSLSSVLLTSFFLSLPILLVDSTMPRAGDSLFASTLDKAVGLNVKKKRKVTDASSDEQAV